MALMVTESRFYKPLGISSNYRLIFPKVIYYTRILEPSPQGLISSAIYEIGFIEKCTYLMILKSCLIKDTIGIKKTFLQKYMCTNWEHRNTWMHNWSFALILMYLFCVSISLAFGFLGVVDYEFGRVFLFIISIALIWFFAGCYSFLISWSF